MTTIATINNFQTFEKCLQTAETKINWLGTRYIILNIHSQVSDQIEKVNISFSTFLKMIHKLSKTLLDQSEIEAGKKVIVYLNEIVLKKFDADLKANCLIRLIVAIRDFFCCFFKRLSQILIDLNKKLSHTLPNIDQARPSPTDASKVMKSDKPELFDLLVEPKVFEENNIALPNPQQDSRSANPVLRTDVFQRVNKEVLDQHFVPFLTLWDYGKLIRVNRHLHQLMKNANHLSFDRWHEKAVYRLSCVYDLLHLPFSEWGCSDINSISASGVLVFTSNDSPLLLKNSYLFNIFNGSLIKTNISNTNDYIKKTFIPKEAFFPPKEENVQLRGNNIYKYDDHYFYITDDYQVSVWSFDNFECIYAVAIPITHDDNKKKSIGIYITNHTIYTWNVNEQIVTITKKELRNIHDPAISIEITLPNNATLSNLSPHDTGLFYLSNACAVIYDWETGAERCRYNCSDLNLEKKGLSLASIPLKNHILICSELSVKGYHATYNPHIIKMDAHTGIHSIMEFPCEEMKGEWKCNNENFLCNSLKSTIFVLDVASSKVSTLNTTFIILDYFVTKKGDIVVRTNKKVLIYKAVTFEIGLELNGDYAEMYAREQILVLKYQQKTSGIDQFEFVNLNTYTSLNHLKLGNPPNLFLTIAEGKIVFVNRSEQAGITIVK